MTNNDAIDRLLMLEYWIRAKPAHISEQLSSVWVELMQSGHLIAQQWIGSGNPFFWVCLLS
jgi:hypothetical protein